MVLLGPSVREHGALGVAFGSVWALLVWVTGECTPGNLLLVRG